MAYTNRKFTWDFDSLKRFYEKYVVKWFNSPVTLTSSQKQQARDNIGISAMNTPYDNTNTHLLATQTQEAITSLAASLKGSAVNYPPSSLPRPLSGYYNRYGQVVSDDTTVYYNQVTVDSEHVDRFMQVSQIGAVTTAGCFVLLYDAAGNVVEGRVLNHDNTIISFNRKIKAGDKFAISCCRTAGTPVIKFLESDSIEARLQALEEKMANVEQHLFEDL